MKKTQDKDGMFFVEQLYNKYNKEKFSLSVAQLNLILNAFIWLSYHANVVKLYVVSFIN